MKPDPDRPLLAASRRLQRPPGRPRKKAPHGHITGTAGLQVPADAGLRGGALAPLASVQPRLLDLQATALYLGVSTWTVRDLEAGGILARVRVPLPGNGELRKLLFDKVQLDELIAKWREAP